MTHIFGTRLYASCMASAFALAMLFPSLLFAQKSLGIKASADTTAALPVAQPQYAEITSTNNTIQVSRLPVSVGGLVVYVDVTLAADFAEGADGNITFNLVPTVVGSPNLLINNFQAGTYVGPADVNGGKNIIVVSGPSPLAGGGSGWTLSTPSGSSTYTYPSSAVWYVEPLASNPLYARITAAKITASTASAYSFGQGDSGSSPNGDWPINALLGFNQVGNTLIVSSFTYSPSYGNTADSAVPVDTITYTLQQQ